MQADPKHQHTKSANSTEGRFEKIGLTVIGMTADGHFFREKVSYAIDGDGFRILAKHTVAEQAGVLLEIDDLNPRVLPTKIHAKIVSAQPSSTSPGMFELRARREGAPAPGRPMPELKMPIPATLSLPALPTKSTQDAPPAMGAPSLPEVASPAASLSHASAAALPEKPEESIAPPSAPAETQASLPASSAGTQEDLRTNLEAFEVSVGFELQGDMHAPEPEASTVSPDSLAPAVPESAEKYVREQIPSRLAHLAPGRDEVAGELKERARELFEQIAGEYREKFMQALEQDLEASKSQAAAGMLETLRSQAASDFEKQKADLREWVVFLQESHARSAAAAAEEAVDKIRARVDGDFQTKLAAAQGALDVKVDQSKQRIADLLSQVESCRTAGHTSLAEVSNAQVQLNLLRRNLKTELGVADSRMANAMQEAMTHLNAAAELRIADGLLRIDSELQTKLTAFRQSTSQQLQAARQQGAGMLNDLEKCRAEAAHSLHTVETVNQTIDQLRESWQLELRAEEGKLQDISRRVLLCASAEATRLLNTAMGNLDERLRQRVSELESSCKGIVSEAAQQLETSAAGVKKSESAAASLLADVDASLNRSTQTLDALNQLQASLSSNAQRLLAAETKNLFSQFQKQLQDQCKQSVALHLSSLEKQAALHVQAAEQALQQLSEEKSAADAACRNHSVMLHAEAGRSMEEFRHGIAHTTERLKTEIENATRSAHESLEQDFSMKIKYLAESTTNLVRRLFHPPDASE